VGWLAGWDKRVKVTIDSTDITAALANFPVLLYLSVASGIDPDDVTFIFDEVGANSLKIAVTEADGTTECKVEIEKWDNGNEKAWLWVKVPAIASALDTDLYLYFDNGHADNNANVGVKESGPGEAVWDANFAAVYHLEEVGGNPQVKDSTSNDEDSVANTSDPTAAGKIDGATEFIAGNTDSTTLTNSQNAGEGTVEAWVKWDVVDGARRPVINDDGAGYLVLTLNTAAVANNHVMFSAFDTIANWAEGITVLNVGTFYHCAGVYKNGEVTRVYVNGVDEGQSPAAMTGDLGGVALALKLAKWGAHYFDGVIDEVRVSSVRRTAAWIAATYESGRDDLVSYGAEETPPSGVGMGAKPPIMELLLAGVLD